MGECESLNEKKSRNERKRKKKERGSDSLQELNANVFIIWQIQVWPKTERATTKITRYAFIHLTQSTAHVCYEGKS